jgi:hypothetical protein
MSRLVKLNISMRDILLSLSVNLNFYFEKEYDTHGMFLVILQI